MKTMKDIQMEIKRLKQNRLIRNKEEFDNFELGLRNLAEVNDSNVIANLCEVFDDNTEDEEVMFGLVHLIEDFEMEKGILETVKAVPHMMIKAKRWTKILHYRILNDDDSREIYENILAKVEENTKQIILSLLIEIKKEDSDRFGRYIDKILVKI
ncbi:MAG: hypothetical protein KAX49_11925 [Halanaerobiales bacterium]|nr:hypothetical protein [Halanaerobiales bacterium]